MIVIRFNQKIHLGSLEKKVRKYMQSVFSELSSHSFNNDPIKCSGIIPSLVIEHGNTTYNYDPSPIFPYDPKMRKYTKILIQYFT